MLWRHCHHHHQQQPQHGNHGDTMTSDRNSPGASWNGGRCVSRRRSAALLRTSIHATTERHLPYEIRVSSCSQLVVSQWWHISDRDDSSETVHFSSTPWTEKTLEMSISRHSITSFESLPSKRLAAVELKRHELVTTEIPMHTVRQTVGLASAAQ